MNQLYYCDNLSVLRERIADESKEQRRTERRAFYLRHRDRLLREMKEYRHNKRDREKAAAYQRCY